ncbi:hypothetical protein [Microbispora sp. NBRC 16548]|nr:hypothetical protein [Microbispora sp. NBRC 16548]
MIGGRLKPRRVDFLCKPAADPWTRLYPEWEDIPSMGSAETT